MGIDTAVLGAGLMGRLIALSLARRGERVALLDAGGPEATHSAARAAAAMLAPMAESAITESNVVKMGQFGLTRWPQLLAELSEPVFFQRDGTLILWHRQDQGEAQRLIARLQQTHVSIPDLPAPQRLDSAAIHQLEPALSGRFANGLYLPGEGQLDNRQLLDALLVELKRQDVDLRWHQTVDAADAASMLSSVPEAARVVDCRGLGARPAWSTLRGVRGEVIRVHAPQVKLSRPTRLVHPRYPLYIAPKPDGLFVIGATEIESEDLSPASVRSTLELLTAAYSVDSGFAEARIVEISTQCRPTLPDNLPAIRQPHPRVLQVNGLYRHGYLIAPAVHDAAIEWLTSGNRALARQWRLA